MNDSRMKRTNAACALPDTEDWWGDFEVNVPPPPLAETRRRRARSVRGMSPASQAMMLLTCVVFVACLFVQIYRLSVITMQTKEIQKLTDQIEDLTSTQQNLEVRLSLQLNLQRIEDEAINKLGMVYPEEEQIRRIAIGGTNDNIVTANAGAEEGGLENIAP